MEVSSQYKMYKNVLNYMECIYVRSCSVIMKIYGSNSMNKDCNWFRIFVFPIQAIIFLN